MIKFGKVVTLRLPADVIATIEQEANRQQVKLSTQIRRIVISAVNKK